MRVQTTIEEKLAGGMEILHLELVNESHMHNVPEGSESHFKAVLVSPEFEGLPLVRRHQKVYGLLSQELRDDVHALALHTYTEPEWREKHGAAPLSPPCLGGGK